MKTQKRTISFVFKSVMYPVANRKEKKNPSAFETRNCGQKEKKKTNRSRSTRSRYDCKFQIGEQGQPRGQFLGSVIYIQIYIIQIIHKTMIHRERIAVLLQGVGTHFHGVGSWRRRKTFFCRLLDRDFLFFFSLVFFCVHTFFTPSRGALLVFLPRRSRRPPPPCFCYK